MLCDIMSTLSWSKIWTVCHNILGPICDVLPAVWRHVDVLSQVYTFAMSSRLFREVWMFCHLIFGHLWCPATCSANCGRFVTGSMKNTDGAVRRKKARNLMRQPFKDPLSHVKVSRNGKIFRKNGPFVTFGWNVTAKLDKNTRTKNVTDFGTKYYSETVCHTVTNRPNLLGQNVTILGGRTIRSPWDGMSL
jgi:hypothetical protein